MLNEALQKRLIAEGRKFLHGSEDSDPYQDAFESDQQLMKPQPPLVKEAITPEETWISLTRDFSGLQLNGDLTAILRNRRSRRVYTDEPLSQDQLSYLLWATQGVKGIRGKAYATLRTVPSGGARHAFETYLTVRHVDGLESGIYHYLPMSHALERIGDLPDEAELTEMLSGQKWGAKAAVVFFWAVDCPRAEWRYGIYAHRILLVDAGHVCENLYLAATALNLGTCGIGAFEHQLTADAFGLDGDREFVIYTAPVGHVRPEDLREEQAFYSFVEEAGW